MPSISTIASYIDTDSTYVDIRPNSAYSIFVGLYELVGRAVRGRREDINLTQAQLARAAGLKRSSISNLEIGTQKVPLEQLVLIARALSCDYRELLPRPKEVSETGTGPITVENLRTQAPVTADFIEQLSGDKTSRRTRRHP
ncbi:MAG: hypothetical protein JWL61_1088 [Gemmatimonadetes bacterium]|nr:hypothetical protein [Gemmatimonadota bacterium]